MPPLARLAALVLVLPASLLGTTSNAGAAAGTVEFSAGDSTSVQDGRTLCVIGTSRHGQGAVTCGGEAVYDALWAGAPCDSMTKMGCGYDGKIRAVRLRDRGAPRRAWISGVGGSIEVKRGQKIKAGEIAGKHLSGGGFRFNNSSSHGFTVTDQAYVAR